MSNNQTKNTAHEKEPKLTIKEILQEHWFLTRLCFAAAPGGMAFHIFESVKLRISIFFEFIWIVNYALGIAERGGSWKQFCWCMVLFMAAVFVSTVSFAYYKQSLLPRVTPVLHQAFRMHIYERTKNLDLACYDDTEFYQKRSEEHTSELQSQR